MTMGVTNGRRMVDPEEEAWGELPEAAMLEEEAWGEAAWEAEAGVGGYGEEEAWGELPEAAVFEEEAWGEAAWEAGAGVGGYGEEEAWGELPEAAVFEEEAWGEAAWEAEAGVGGYGEEEAWGELPEAAMFEEEAWGEAAWEAGAGVGGYGEEEADQFLPLLAAPLAGMAAKRLPAVARAAVPAVKRILPFARRAASRVARNVLRASGTGGLAGLGPAGAEPAGAEPTEPDANVGALLRELSGVLSAGERVAAEAEAGFFGPNELQAELAGTEPAHEVALTEVLAAEAAHTASESEAQALLGPALPVTVRAMGGSRRLRSLLPVLARIHACLVRALRQSGPAGPELLRLVPAIDRRVVGSLLAARRAGRPVPPRMVAPVVAGHTARVLGTPRISGPALVRNTAVRQGTVAPAGQRIRPRRAGSW